MVTAVNLTPAFPELFLAAAGLILLVVGAWREDDEGQQLVSFLAVVAMFVAAAIVIGSSGRTVTTFGGHFVVDSYAAFLKVLILIGAALTLALAPAFLKQERIQRFEFSLLALFATLGMLMMVSANSFLALYMALELQSLPLYVMAAFHRDNTRSTEAGLKYFVLGALASGILLYGCSMVYGFTGTVSFRVLRGLTAVGETAAPLPAGALVGMVFIAAGLAFKIAAVPFHMWTPDVYEGAPTPVTAFFATAPKIAALGLTVRVLHQPFGAWVADWQQIIVFISVASMGLGAYAAIAQSNIKRLMAYSGIGHVGFALVALAAGTERGVYSLLIYLLIYLAMTVGTFGCILAMRRQGRYIETIEDLAGLGKSQPLMALALAIFMFSLAGIPPLAGFFGKLYVFMAAIDAGLTLLAVIGVLASVVGAFYYLRIVKIMYFDAEAEAFDRPVGREVTIISGLTAAFIMLFILYPSPFLEHAETAAASLFQ